MEILQLSKSRFKTFSQIVVMSEENDPQLFITTIMMVVVVVTVYIFHPSINYFLSTMNAIATITTRFSPVCFNRQIFVR